MTEVAPLDVLLIEDNPIDVRLLRDELREAGAAGFRVTHAAGLAQALACLEERHFDVVLTDLSVPDSFGLATLEAVLGRAGDTPVVVLTGSEEDRSGLAAVQLGAQDYLVKGETGGEMMLRSLLYAIERKQTEVALRQTNEQLAERVRKQIGRYNEALQLETLERYRIEAALRESERRFRSAFEQAAVGMAHLSVDGQFLRVNLKLCETLGHSEGEMLATTLAELTEAGERDLDQPQRRRLLDGAIQNYSLERGMRRKDGRALRMRQTFSLVRSDRGEPRYLAVVFESAAGQGAVEECERRLGAVRNELEAAHAELDALSYSVSHDLRAPLRAVIGFTRILVRDHASRLDDEARQYLGLVNESAQRLDQLIRDILAYSRIGRQPLAIQRVDAASLMRECLRQLQPLHEGREVEFLVGELPECAADPQLLKELFLALIGNAIKFSRHRQPARVEIAAEQAAGEMRFMVRDNGIGFDMRYAHKLFGVFQRLHRADEYEGTGIGLAIAQRIVQRHGGRIWADAVPDAGAAFCFALPADAS